MGRARFTPIQMVLNEIPALNRGLPVDKLVEISIRCILLAYLGGVVRKSG